VREALTTLGQSEGYSVYSGRTGSEEHSPDRDGWVFGLCWAAEGVDGTVELKLACEMDWDPRPETVLDSFRKLTVSVAEFRLLVFSNRAPRNTFRVREGCRRACPGSRGFRYLLVGVPDGDPSELYVDAFAM
jgi:hypothetical protein